MSSHNPLLSLFLTNVVSLLLLLVICDASRDVRFSSQFPREKKPKKKIKKKNRAHGSGRKKKARLSRFCPTPFLSLSL
jgi:hypothetical protein